MADETASVAPSAPAPAPTPAPAPSAVAPAAASGPPPAPQAETAPPAVAPSAPAAPSSPDAPKVESPAQTPTVLGEALKPAETPKPPAEAPKAEAAPAEQPKAPEGQSAEPAPPPSYEAFTSPEGVTLTAEGLGKFTGMLGEFELASKAEHAEVQKFGQKLVDYHVAEVRNALTAQRDALQNAWTQQRDGWKEQFLKDPELGGNRSQTTVDAARAFIRTHGGTEEQQAEFRSLMESSGLGNHPAMIRLLAKAGAAMSEGRPLAATLPAPQPRSKTATLYGRKAS